MKRSRLKVVKKDNPILFQKIRLPLLTMGKEDETMYSLSYLKVQGNKIIATDGHCLCISNLDGDAELKDGFYLPLKNTRARLDIIRDADYSGDYPDWEVIEKQFNGQKTDYTEIYLMYSDCYGLSKSFTRISRSLHPENSLNIAFIEKYLELEKAIVPAGENMLTKLVDKGVEVYIMPLKM